MQLRRQKEEQEKWKDVPEWKRKILMEKAQLKQNEDFEVDEVTKKSLPTFGVIILRQVV